MVFIKNTPVAIDEFGYLKGTHIYLLSHFHTDHLKGLNSKWNFGTIYCSNITKDLIIKKFRINPKLIIGVEFDETKWIQIVPYDNCKETIQCTFFRSYHCYGSMMFYLCGYFGNIFYSGDFRLHKNMIYELNGITGLIDHLYLDTTHLQKSINFPSRDSIILNNVSLLQELKTKNKKLFVACDKFGKEDMLMIYSDIMKGLVYVNNERLEFIKIIEKYDNSISSDHFTTDITKAIIIVVDKSNLDDLIIGDNLLLIPSINKKFFKKDMKIINQQYSDHSNQNEIDMLVRLLTNDKRVIERIFDIKGVETKFLNNRYKRYLKKDTGRTVEIPGILKQYYLNKKF